MRSLIALSSALLLLVADPGAAAEQKGAKPESRGRLRTLSLSEAVELALQNNLNLLFTVDSVSSALISEQLAQSRFGLKLTPAFSRGFGSQASFDQRYGLEISRKLPFGTSVSASVRSDLSRSDLGSLASSNFDFVLSQPLLRGLGPRSARFELENARRQVESSERSLELTRQRLAVEVVASYYNIVRQQGLIEVAENSVERSKELLRASEARLKVGLASKLDVYRAELQLSQAEESLITRREALELAVDNFKFNLGLGPEAQLALEMLEPDYEPFPVELDSLSAQALANRIELREERDRARDAERALAVSRQNLLPQLDLNLRYEQRGLGPSLRDSFTFRDRGFDVFFSTSYPLDRSAESAAAALSRIQFEARQRSLRLAEHNIANEVRASARNLERIGKSILLQERNIDFAEKQQRLANLRYQRGLASNFDIIDAENNLIQARSNYVSLLADYRVALIELKRVTGTLDVVREFAPSRLLPPARHHP